MAFVSLYDPEDSYVPVEVDTSGWTIDKFRGKRSGSKARVTKKITALERSITNKDSRGAIRLLGTQLVEKIQDCRYWHQRLIAVLDSTAESNQQETAWLEEVEKKVSDAQEAMRHALVNRSDVSSVCGSTATDASSRRLELQHSREEKELLLEAEKRRLDREMDQMNLKKAQIDDDLAVAAQQVELAIQHEEEEAALRRLETNLCLEPEWQPDVPNRSVSFEFPLAATALPLPVFNSAPAPAPAPVPVRRTVPVPAPVRRAVPVAAPVLRTATVPFTTEPTAFINLPKITIERFDGDVKKWPLFLADFTSAVDGAGFSNAHKMAYLRSFLTEKVRNGIAQFMFDPHLYPQAMDELKRQYGHPYVIALAHIKTMLDLEAVKDNATALAEFANVLNGSVGALSAGEYRQELYSSGILAQLSAKIPIRLQQQWSSEIYVMQPRPPTILDFCSWLNIKVRSEHFRNPFSATSSIPRADSQPGGRKPQQSGRGGTVFATAMPTPVASQENECLVCEGAHSLNWCKKFEEMSVERRMELVREKRLCICCLKSGHGIKKCFSQNTCRVTGCQSKHNTKLHDAPALFPRRVSESSISSEGVIQGFNGHCRTVSSVLLLVVPIRISANGKVVETKALLDNGSQLTLVRQDIVDELGLEGPTQELSFGTFHGMDPEIPTKKVSFLVSAKNSSFSVSVGEAYSVPVLNIPSGETDLLKLQSQWEHLSDLELNPVDPREVTVLLGMNVRSAHDTFDSRRPKNRNEAPEAVLTPFGWVIVGPTGKKNSGSKGRCFYLSSSTEERDKELSAQVERFWRTEALGVRADVKALISSEEKQGLVTLNSTINNLGSRYEIGLMWRSPSSLLPNNRQMALRRFYALEKGLMRKLDRAKNYSRIVNEYISLGFASRVPADYAQFYIPHHAVTTSEKLRVVFNASAEYQGVSLNKSLCKGPDLLISLLGVFLRFRLNRIPVSSDIEKMFHQVRVLEEDRPNLSFIWREPGSEDPPSTYCMSVHIFDAISSPSTCQFVLNRTAEDNRSKFPEVADLVKKSFYVDNFLHSFENEEEATRKCEGLYHMLQKGGFRLTKWLSSSRQVMAGIKSEERIQPTLNLDLDPLPTEKTLGVYWDSENDVFLFKIKPLISANTKRAILSATSSVYDPIGFLSPVILTSKMLLQELWKEDFHWDENLPDPLLEVWKGWSESLMNLADLRIPRCFNGLIVRPRDRRLHVFADASERGFGAVVYIRAKDEKQVCVNFVMSKARVAPIKYLSIPRLELQSAVLGVRLALTCCQELGIPISEVTFWTDSTTVLQWIRSRKCRFQTFVANRIGEILESTNKEQWRHIPGRLNPADICSRGISAADITSDHIWFCGPVFLKHEEVLWPENILVGEPEEDRSEMVSAYVYATRSDVSRLQEQSKFIVELLDRHSSWMKLIRVVSWMLRIFRRRNIPTEADVKRTLSAEELERASSRIIRIVQQTVFPIEISSIVAMNPILSNSPLVSVSPFLDDQGMLRVGGRLGRSSLPFDAKHPVILRS